MSRRTPSRLRPMQRSLLRYWAMNMASLNYEWFPFEYDTGELVRLAAIVGPIPSRAYVLLVLFSAIFYLLGAAIAGAIFLTPLLIVYPRIPDLLFFTAVGAALLFMLSIGMPIALAFAGRIIDWMLKVPPFEERANDLRLYAKIRRQFAVVALVAVGSLALLLGASAVFDVDTNQYAATIRWLYGAVLLCQGILAARFFVERR